MPASVARLRARLALARRRLTAAAVVRGLLVALAAVGALAVAAVSAEAALWMGPGLRTAIVWTAGLLGAGLLAVEAGVPLGRGLGWLPGLGDRAVAARADRDHPGVGGRLATVLDLADGHASASPDAFRAAALDALAAEVADVPFERVTAWTPTRRVLPYTIVSLLLLAAGLVLAPTVVGGAALRLLAPGTDFARPAAFVLTVTPGDATVSRGASVAVTTVAQGRELPLGATLEIERDGERRAESLRMTPTPPADSRRQTFAHRLAAVRSDVRYRVVADGVASPWHTLRVVDRPVVQSVRVAVTEPRAAGGRTRLLPEGIGGVTAPQGSAVRVQVGLGGLRPTRGWLEIDWDAAPGAKRVRTRVPLRIGSEGAMGRFRLRGPGRYRIRLVAPGGLTNEAPAEYPLGTLVDAPPAIVLTDGGEAALSDAPRWLAFQISDDYGFAGGSVVWRVVGRTGARRLALPVRARPLAQAPMALWRLPGARRGDVVELFGEVRDTGGQTARTPVITLRYTGTGEPPPDALTSARDSTRRTLDAARRTAAQSAQRADRLRDALRRSPRPDSESQRQARELLREQAEMQRQADALRDQMRQMADELRRSGAADPATQQMAEQMQQVMDELSSPELREAMQRLMEAMQRLDVRQTLDAAERTADLERQMQRRLERAMEMMRRLEAAVELQSAAREADALAEQQEDAAADAERLDTGEVPADDAERRAQDARRASTPEAERRRLEAEQRQAAERAAALEQQLRDLREQLEGVRRAPTDAVDEALQEMQRESSGAPQESPESGESPESSPESSPSESESSESESSESESSPSESSPSESSPSESSPTESSPSGMERQMQRAADQIRQGAEQQAAQRQRDAARRFRRMARQMQQASQGMQGQQQQVDAAALRRALEDVLAISRDQERLAGQTARTPDDNPALVGIARRQRELGDGFRAVADTLLRVGRTVPQLGAAVQTRADAARAELTQALDAARERQARRAVGSQRMAMSHLNELALLLAEVLDNLQDQQQQASGSGGGNSGSPSAEQMQQMGEAQQRLNGQIQQMLNQIGSDRLSGDGARRARQLAEQQEALRRQLEGLSRSGGIDAQTRSALQRLNEQMRETAGELRSGRPTSRTVPRQQEILERLLQAEQAAQQRGQEEQREGEAARAARRAPAAPPPAVPRPPDRLRPDVIRGSTGGYAPDYQDLIRRYFARLRGS